MVASQPAASPRFWLLTLPPQLRSSPPRRPSCPPTTRRGRVGIERGVDIVPVYPAPKSGAVQSPFNFRVKFRSHGNTEIDLDSLVVVYKKIPEIDLTQRLRPFVQPDGINMPSAEVPPGAHRILIFLRDSVGHGGEADIRFEVEK